MFLKSIPMSKLHANEKPKPNPYFQHLMDVIITTPELIVQGVHRREDCEDLWIYEYSEEEDEFLDNDKVNGQFDDGSWYNMLISNPPCPIHLIEFIHDQNRTECSALEIGQLIQCLKESAHSMNMTGKYRVGFHAIADTSRQGE